MKKITSLIWSGILSITLFFATGCEDNGVVENNEELQIVEEKEQREQEVEEKEEVQVEEPKQEQVEDEDLNREYKYKVTQNEELEVAKRAVEYAVGGTNTPLEWKVIIDEKNNAVWLQINITREQYVAMVQNGEWDEIVDVYISHTREMKNIFEEKGYSVNYGVMIGDMYADNYWLGVFNGEVIYNADDK